MSEAENRATNFWTATAEDGNGDTTMWVHVNLTRVRISATDADLLLREMLVRCFEALCARAVDLKAFFQWQMTVRDDLGRVCSQGLIVEQPVYLPTRRADAGGEDLRDRLGAVERHLRQIQGDAADRAGEIASIKRALAQLPVRTGGE